MLGCTKCTNVELIAPNGQICSYQEFRDFSEQASALLVIAFGTGKLKATDISVSVEGEWAYATLTLLWNDHVVAELTSTEPDIWRKADSTW